MRLIGKKIEIDTGAIQVGPKPRGGDWLRDDLERLKSESFTFVASLLTEAEVLELRLLEEQTTCDDLGLSFFTYPIPDRHTPADRKSFEQFATTLLEIINDGGCGFFHCRAGLGRAPLLACTILVQAGMEAEAAWQMIQASRGQAVPDTEEQRAWVGAGSNQALSLEDALQRLVEGDEPA